MAVVHTIHAKRSHKPRGLNQMNHDEWNGRVEAIERIALVSLLVDPLPKMRDDVSTLWRFSSNKQEFRFYRR